MSDILELQSVFLSRLLTSGILFSSFPIFVSKTVVVTKRLMAGIFYQHLRDFSQSFVYLRCIICFMCVKVVAELNNKFCFLKFLLLNLVY